MDSSSNSRLRIAAAGALIVMLSGLPLAAQANETVALKHALYGAGYEIENVSGSMDAATREALEAFQQDHPDLTVTGELDEPTKKALGLVPVEIAANGANGEEATTRTQGGSAGAVEPSAAVDTKPDVEGGVEEDDDGGWSLF